MSGRIGTDAELMLAHEKRATESLRQAYRNASTQRGEEREKMRKMRERLEALIRGARGRHDDGMWIEIDELQEVLDEFAE